ncbi:MAG: D-alanyl-D-alanine carboxypeptidase family protein, partial [Oscillospiraceae bacterium]|nr:D-alanyl-D-alanine carboxypeptidase family protein [Oscillospiraceae bacterium]
FNDTAEAQWLEAHCAEYGFVIRFPREKEAYTGYKYESWHIRYVGVEWAEQIMGSGLCMEEFFNVKSVYP